MLVVERNLKKKVLNIHFNHIIFILEQFKSLRLVVNFSNLILSDQQNEIHKLKDKIKELEEMLVEDPKPELGEYHFLLSFLSYLPSFL